MSFTTLTTSAAFTTPTSGKLIRNEELFVIIESSSIDLTSLFERKGHNNSQ